MNPMTFPRDIGTPQRKVMLSQKEFFKYLNANLSSCNLYTNVYNFSDFRSPEMHPMYETAIIDRIYIDCDQRIKEGGEWVLQPAYENMLKVHNWCLKENLIHYPRFTGSGYDIVILTADFLIQNKKECVGNAQQFIMKTLDIKTDPQVIGDLARLQRIEGSFNHKPHARRFCIPLSPDIIYTGEQHILEIAKKQQFGNNRYGEKLWDIQEFDTKIPLYRELQPLHDIHIDESQFAELSENTPPCIKLLLSRHELHWKERRIIILFLRDNCYLLDECSAILKKHLTPKKYIHCIRDEKQHLYLYRNEKYSFPRQQEILELQACPYPCGTFCPMAKTGCLNYERSK